MFSHHFKRSLTEYESRFEKEHGFLLIAFITDYPAVGRIINYLQLTFVVAKPPPPHMVYLELLMAAKASSEYFS